MIREADSAKDESHNISNTFFPDFFITDEERLKGKQPGTQNSLSLEGDAGYESQHHTFYYLSEPLSASGHTEFVSNLLQRKQKGQRNIIFLGTFSSPTEDVHQTIYTDLHGPTIILNILYALHLKRHYLTLPFILILLIGYSVISWVLIYRSLKLPFFSKAQTGLVKKHAKPLVAMNEAIESWWKKTYEKLKNYKAVKMLISVVDFLIEFVFVEELHLVLLVALIYVVKKTTGQMINGMSLLIYLAVINALLRYAKAHISADQQIKPLKKKG